jgi:hypothetical protein
MEEEELFPIHFRVNKALKQRLDALPHGTRTHAMRTLSAWLCDMYERHGDIGLGAIIGGDFKLMSDKIVNKV